jgi:hypothetical protein
MKQHVDSKGDIRMSYYIIKQNNAYLTKIHGSSCHIGGHQKNAIIFAHKETAQYVIKDMNKFRIHGLRIVKINNRNPSWWEK